MNEELKNKCLKADFRKIFKKLNYAYFDKGNYNVNIIGVRSNQNNKVTNQYDDILIVKYKVDNKWVTKTYSITTEPGLSQVIHPSNAKGVAILAPNQYRGVYKIDLHRQKYKALCQRNGTVQIYRDNNKDLIYDYDARVKESGWYGINIHRSDVGFTRKTIDNYSAGCQVFNNPTEFNEFMSICETSKSIYGNKFTYTLINEEDL